MEDHTLEATKRDVIGKQVRRLRREGLIPAVIYGSGLASFPISLDTKTASKILARTTSSSLIQLVVDGDSYPALVRDQQRDVISGAVLHVDFQVVSLTERVRADVSIQHEGESPSVKQTNAILVTGLEALEVEALPQDLPSSIAVDISVLVEWGDTIYVRDIAVPPNVEILNDPDEMVVLVTGREIVEEEEEVEEEEFLEGEEPEVIERGKREDEDEEEAEEE